MQDTEGTPSGAAEAKRADCDSTYVHHTHATTPEGEPSTTGMSMLAITDLDPEISTTEQE